jgi:hypothetical protein
MRVDLIILGSRHHDQRELTLVPGTACLATCGDLPFSGTGVWMEFNYTPSQCYPCFLPDHTPVPQYLTYNQNSSGSTLSDTMYKFS